MSKRKQQKVNLRKIQADAYASTKDFNSINKEYGQTGQFVGTFEEMKEIDTDYGVTKSFIFNDLNGEEWSLLTKSKHFFNFFTDQVTEGDTVTISKDTDMNLWFVDEVQKS